MWTSLQYRILKFISPAEPTTLSGKFYSGDSKIRMLLGDRLLGQIAGKTVVDFGCGEGSEAVDLVRQGAAQVIGIDVRQNALEKARVLALSQGVAAKCIFTTTCDVQADLIVSIDSFEHFTDPAAVLQVMYQLLKPGGKILASFGPTWYHPLGGHLFSVFPWAHLVFSEKALIRWRTDIRTDGATRFSEVEGGLNQMTISRFERLARHSPFELTWIEAVPIRKLRLLHNSWTREFTSSIVRAELQKPVSTNASSPAIRADASTSATSI